MMLVENGLASGQCAAVVGSWWASDAERLKICLLFLARQALRWFINASRLRMLPASADGGARHGTRRAARVAIDAAAWTASSPRRSIMRHA